MKHVTSLIITAFCSMITNYAVFAQGNSASLTPSGQQLTGTIDTTKVASLSRVIRNDKVYLNWTVEGNQDADRFEVESSKDGRNFEMAALVFGTGKQGADEYWFFEKKNKAKAYYRIKIIRTNGSVAYSSVSLSAEKNNIE